MKLKKHNDIATLQQRLEQKTLGANKQVWYPARHGIPHGTISRAARYPTRRGIRRHRSRAA
jgi:hypothetical protein